MGVGTKALLVLCLHLAALSSAKASSHFQPWTGKWLLNPTETHYPDGFGILKDHLIQVVQDDGNRLRFVESMVAADGDMIAYTFAGAYDGKPYVAGDYQLAFTHVTETSYRDRWNHGSEIAGEDLCTFSADLRTIRCDGRFTKAGKTETYTETWNKID